MITGTACKFCLRAKPYNDGEYIHFKNSYGKSVFSSDVQWAVGKKFE